MLADPEGNEACVCTWQDRGMTTFESTAVGAPVDVRVLTPPDGADGVPMLLLLHGVMTSAASLDLYTPTIETLWASGELPPCVVGCASTPTQGGFYIDWPGGPAWEAVVADELPAHLTAAHGADPKAHAAVIGASMGGYRAR